MRSSSRRLDGIALAIVQVAAAVAIVAAGCQDAGCSCTPSSDTTTTMICRWAPSNASAAQMPAVTSPDITAAYFTKYNLGALANGSFSGSGQQPLRQIVTLSLDNNGIASIERYSLSGLVGLVSLSVASNSVQQLPARVFDGLAQLRQLDLRDNQLDALAGDTFVGLVQLRQLDLSGNALRTLPPAAFAPLQSLERLDLSGNALRTLPPAAFAPLQSLERLDLSSNFIESLAGEFLSGLASLTWLSLSSNRLTSLTAADGGGGSLFAVASRLQALDVSLNRLTQLPAASGWLANLTSLVALNLSGNYAPCDCGAALALRTWLDTTAIAAPIKSHWVANPARSGTCSAPPPLAGTYFVNVPAVSLACVVTTSTAAATTRSTAATTNAAAEPSPSVSGGVTTGTQAAISQDATTTTAGPVLLGGSTLAIVLGCSIGAAVLLIIILATWAVRRRLKRRLQQQQQSPPTSSKAAIARPKTDSASAAAIAAAILKSDGLRQDGGGWRNGAYTSSPSTDSPNGGDGGGRQSGQPAQTLQSPPPHLALPPPGRAAAAAALSSSEATDAGGPAQGYYDRVAADLKEGATTGEPRSPVRMNGLLPFAYTRQNSARSTAIEQARTKAMLQLGSSSASASRPADDIDRASTSSASATLRFYASHGALSPTTSSSNGGGDVGLFSAAAGDRSRLRRSLPRSLAVRSEPLGRNATLTSSLRHGAAAAGGRELARSLSGATFDDAAPLDADDASTTAVQHSLSTPHQPAFWSPASGSSGFYENVGPPLVVATPSVLPHEAAAVALQPPGTPRTPSWLDGASTQFSFSPQHHSPEMRRLAPAPPPPADYSTMGSSRSLSAASGSLHSGHGGGRVSNDLKRFVNDTPV